jgi:hypothetical protein
MVKQPLLTRYAKPNRIWIGGRDGVKLKYIFEPISTLICFRPRRFESSQTGAPSFMVKMNALHDGQEFSIGNIKIKVLHTRDIPWKVPLFLLIDETEKTIIFSEILCLLMWEDQILAQKRHT